MANQNREGANDTQSKSSNNPGNFKNDRKKAVEAGRKGGQAKGKKQ